MGLEWIKYETQNEDGEKLEDINFWGLQNGRKARHLEQVPR